MALTMLWGSYLSRIKLVGGKPTAMAKPFRRGIFNAVGLNAGKAMEPTEVQLEAVWQRIALLMEQP